MDISNNIQTTADQAPVSDFSQRNSGRNGEKQFDTITIESVRKILNGVSINDEFILFDNVTELPLPDEPRRMGCILVALCLNGKAQYSVDTEEHLMHANDIIIISEGQITDSYMLSRDFRCVALMISTNFFNEIVKNVHEMSSLFLFSRSHPVFRLSQEEVRTIIDYLRILKKKVEETDHHFRIETVQSLLTTVIYDLSNTIYRVQNISDKKRTRAESIFADFIKLVEQHYKTERRVSWYSQQLFISPKYLSETIRQVSRRTPNEWIDNYVTLEIRVQLKNSTKSIKEIADDLNFPNQSFLGKFFKEHVGVSPSEYRKR